MGSCFRSSPRTEPFSQPWFSNLCLCCRICGQGCREEYLVRGTIPNAIFLESGQLLLRRHTSFFALFFLWLDAASLWLRLLLWRNDFSCLRGFLSKFPS